MTTRIANRDFLHCQQGNKTNMIELDGRTIPSINSGVNNLNMAGTIFVDQGRCKGCGLCISVCPPHVLELDEDSLNTMGYHPAVLVDPEDQCTGCSVCAIICPDVAITVFRQPRPQRQRTAAAG